MGRLEAIPGAGTVPAPPWRIRERRRGGEVMRRAIETRKVGFTLVELLVVIAILALLISLILVASADGVRRAEERATQALITKLETAVNDRIDALLNTQPPINQTHRLLAAINTPVAIGQNTQIQPLKNNSDDRRAQIFAQFDYIRAELPDVFLVNARASDGTSAYPLNFAAAPYPAGTNTFTSGTTVAQGGQGSQDGGSWVLPLGNTYPGLPGFYTPVAGQVNQLLTLTITQPPIATTGMFGASFSAAASVYKNLYTAAASDLTAASSSCSVNFEPGLDGVDNNGDGLVDELVSPSGNNPEIVVTGTPSQPFSNYVAARLAKHTHKTARAEVLYALLVDGLSPLGSAFTREDFTAREVQDTDGDGMPEFVDAWGEPLQFFRWPIYYGGPQPNGQILGTSDSQKGFIGYSAAVETRQQDPLDPNQVLVSPGWWASAANPSTSLGAISFNPPNGNGTNQSSPGAIAFMNYFHSLVDPNPAGLGQSPTAIWDRGARFTRREYFTKFLILSGGPDHEPGVGQFAKDYSQLVDSSQFTLSSPYMVPFPHTNSSGTADWTMEHNALALIYIENQAAVNDPVWRLGSSSGSFFEEVTPVSASGTTASAFLSTSANSDDITNHNISGISTGVR
jgi:prepilin-type N-terminal cleavage/methylation domain-containing protein